MPSTNPTKNLIIESSKELSTLYFAVKDMVLLAEEVCDAFPMDLTNEIRNSLDHFMRIFKDARYDDVDEVQRQFVSASRHLKRAGYDACELIVGGYVSQTFETFSNYDFEVLNKVMGKRYTEIKLFLTDVKEKYLSEARKNKNLKTNIEDDHEIDELYAEFAKIVSKTREIRNEAIAHEPIFLECKSSMDNKQKKELKLKLGLIVVSVIIGILLRTVWGWYNNQQEPPSKNSTTTETKIKTGSIKSSLNPIKLFLHK